MGRQRRDAVRRDETGALTYMGGVDRQRQLIAGLPLVDVVTGASLTVGDLGAV